MKTLKECIEEIQSAWNSVEPKLLLQPTADMVLDCATRIYNTLLIQNHAPPGKMSGLTSSPLIAPPDGPPTEKQIHMIKKLNIPYHAGMTKREATKLIGEKLGK